MSGVQSIPMWQIENLFYLADENKDGKTTFAELIKYLIAKGFPITNQTFDKLLDHFTIPIDNLKEELFGKYYPQLAEMDEEKKDELIKKLQEQSEETPLTLFKINKFLHQQQIQLNQANLVKLMDTFAINIDEFLEVFNQLFPETEILKDKNQISDEEVETLFKTIDSNGNGQLDLSEIMTFLAKNGYKFNTKQCEDLIKKYDYNNDKQLNLTEFTDFTKELLRKQ